MHIAINAHLLSPSAGYRQAGVSGYIQETIRRLWPLGEPHRDRWTVYAPRGVTPDMIDVTPAVTLRHSRLPTTNPLARIVWEQAVAPPLLLRDRPDVLFCPLNVVPFIAPCPSVVTIHDLAFLRFRMHKAAKRLYLSLLTRLSVRRATRIITVSEFTRREVIELLGVDPQRITAISNGVDARFRPVDQVTIDRFRAAHALPDRFLLSVGTLEPRKNISTLIRAYAQARDRIGMPLIIGGGKGWLYDEIFALVRQLGLADQVRFAGFIARDDLPLYYATATAFVYPSIYEGFGLPLLEAMASGTPVLTSTADALVEVAGDAAITFPPRDVPTLAEALTTIANDEAARADLRTRGFERVGLFSWDRTAAETLRVLHEVAS